MQFEITPKAFANFSPGFEVQTRTLGNTEQNSESTLKGFLSRRTLSGLNRLLVPVFPGLSLRSNRWAEISERLRRILTGGGKIVVEIASSRCL